MDTRREPDPLGFPQVEAERGIFRDYAEIVSPTTEAPRVFHFAAMLAIVSVLFGRRAWFHLGCPLYPNGAWTVSIARTAARKSTAQSNAMRYVLAPARDALGLSRAELVRIAGVSSGEGLLECFADIPADEESPGLTGRRAIITLDEFAVALRKARQGGNRSSTLVEILLQAADGHDEIANPTRTCPLVATNACVAFTGATTPSGFAEDLDNEHIDRGLINRILFFTGSIGAPLSVPPAPDENRLQSFVGDLVRIVSDAPSGRVAMNTAALGVFDDWYRAEFARREGGELDPRVANATGRIDGHAARLALIFALCDQSGEITPEHVNAGIGVSEYCAGVIAGILGSHVTDRRMRDEHRVVSGLRALAAESPDRYVSRRELQQRVGGKRGVPADVFNRVVQAYVTAGAWHLTEDNRIGECA